MSRFHRLTYLPTPHSFEDEPGLTDKTTPGRALVLLVSLLALQTRRKDRIP